MLYLKIFCLQLAKQFGPLPGSSQSTDSTAASTSTSQDEPSSQATPSKQRNTPRKRGRSKTPKKGPKKASASSTAVRAEGNESLEAMQDRMEGILDARLSETSQQAKESQAFTTFLQACLPSFSEDIFSQFITNVTAYTRQCMQLSRAGGPRNESQMAWQEQQALPRVLFGEMVDNNQVFGDVIDADAYLPGPSSTY